MKYMMGCNYWGSKYGTDMWKKWDAESVRNDFKAPLTLPNYELHTLYHMKKSACDPSLEIAGCYYFLE